MRPTSLRDFTAPLGNLALGKIFYYKTDSDKVISFRITTILNGSVWARSINNGLRNVFRIDETVFIVEKSFDEQIDDAIHLSYKIHNPWDMS